LREFYAALKKAKPKPTRRQFKKLERLRVMLWHERAYVLGKCRQCGKPSEIKPSTGWPFRYCAGCRAKVAARDAAKKKRAAPVVS
jgi:hypothetical protein